jgi:hypothetical protein
MSELVPQEEENLEQVREETFAATSKNEGQGLESVAEVENEEDESTYDQKKT